MAQEIERKFLVRKDDWAPKDDGIAFKQGYLSTHKERVVRVRIEGHKAKLTIKGVTTGISRAEFEYPIPVEDAAMMLERLCEQPLIDKHRHLERFGGHLWEIDVFHGENDGLIVAEVELASEHEALTLPPWAGEDVSADPRYFNSNLLKHPFKTWR